MLDSNLLNSQQFSSLGNIVTAGLRLYFIRFKPCLRMAITAHLWLLIPVYGWLNSARSQRFWRSSPFMI